MHYPTIGTLLIIVPVLLLALYYLLDHVERLYLNKSMNTDQQSKFDDINQQSGSNLVMVMLLTLAGLIIFNIILFVLAGEGIAYIFLPLLLKELLIVAPFILLYLTISQYKRYKRYQSAGLPASLVNYSRVTLQMGAVSFLLLIFVYWYYWS